MATQREFQKLANQCLKFAEQADDHNERQTFLEVAAALKQLARLQCDTARAIRFDEVRAPRPALLS